MKRWQARLIEVVAGLAIGLGCARAVHGAKPQSLAAFAASNPPWGDSESTAERARRVRMIVRVVAEETRAGAWPAQWSHQDRVAAVFTKIWYESSHLSRAVHDGSKRGDKGKAICLGQVHRNGMPVEQWSALAGVDEAATRRCVQTVQRYLVGHLWRCGRGGRTLTAVARAFVGYGTGGPCEIDGRSWALDRARSWEWFRMMEI